MALRAISMLVMLSVCFLNACGGGGGGGGGTPTPPDTSAPYNVAITSVAKGGTTVTGTVSGTLLVNATAADAVGVTKVELYVDNVLKATDTSAPFALTWYTTTATNAVHSLTVKAYDAANNSSTSSAVSLTVNNSISVSLATTILSGTASGTISLAGAPTTVQGVQVIVTSPAGTVFLSADAIGGATGGLVSVDTDPLGKFIGVITTSTFSSGNILSVDFNNVPVGSTPADFSVILVAVADGASIIQ